MRWQFLQGERLVFVVLDFFEAQGLQPLGRVVRLRLQRERCKVEIVMGAGLLGLLRIERKVGMLVMRVLAAGLELEVSKVAAILVSSLRHAIVDKVGRHGDALLQSRVASDGRWMERWAKGSFSLLLVQWRVRWDR